MLHKDGAYEAGLPMVPTWESDSGDGQPEEAVRRGDSMGVCEILASVDRVLRRLSSSLSAVNQPQPVC